MRLIVALLLAFVPLMGQTSIAGKWKIVEMDGAGVVQPEKTIGMELDAVGTVQGFAGCNRFRGGYTAEGARLKFHTVTSTLMACERLSTENAFLGALRHTASFRTVDSQLHLLDRDGSVIAKFDRQ